MQITVLTEATKRKTLCIPLNYEQCEQEMKDKELRQGPEPMLITHSMDKFHKIFVFVLLILPPSISLLSALSSNVLDCTNTSSISCCSFPACSYLLARQLLLKTFQLFLLALKLQLHLRSRLVSTTLDRRRFSAIPVFACCNHFL